MPDNTDANIPTLEEIGEVYDRLRPNLDTYADPCFEEAIEGQEDLYKSLAEFAALNSQIDAEENRTTKQVVRDEAAWRVALAAITIGYGPDAVIDRFGHPCK